MNKLFEKQITEAHPDNRSIEPNAKIFARWDLAMRIVGERHEKMEFVALVNFFLTERDKLNALRDLNIITLRQIAREAEQVAMENLK